MIFLSSKNHETPLYVILFSLLCSAPPPTRAQVCCPAFWYVQGLRLNSVAWTVLLEQCCLNSVAWIKQKSTNNCNILLRLEHTRYRCNISYRLTNLQLVWDSDRKRMASVNTAANRQYFSISRLKNLKRKIVKCKSNIYFKEQTINRGLVLKYDRIQVPNSCSATKFAITKRNPLLCNTQ
jgi:hypothetical protein